MTTTVIYADSADGYLASTSLTYATAADGLGTVSIGGTGGNFCGQRSIAAGNFSCWETFLSFDTSTITGATVSSAVLDLYGQSDSSATDFVMRARLFAFGTLAVGDFTTPANMPSQTLLCHWDTASGWSTAAYNTFVDDAFAANVVQGGNTQMGIYSSRHQSSTAPASGTNEYVGIEPTEASGTSKDPKITVTWTAGGGGGGARSLVGAIYG